MVNACLEITTTRDIARQILRHRSFSFQEFCITGDSTITCGWYNKRGKFVPHYISIATLYERQSWDDYKNILAKVYDETEKIFTTTSIKEVFRNGIKPVFRVTLSDGKQIECTKEHKFLSRNGWDTLENISGLSITKTNLVKLTNTMEVAVDSNKLIPKFVRIKNIEYIGERETYDMEVDHTSHNYIANKICVHNSQRYANVTDSLNFETRETRLQDTKNRQNSIEIEDPNLSKEWEQKQRDLINHSIDIYNWAIANNIAKEQARVVLPEGNTQSRMYMNGTLRSWVHYIELRSGNGTQKEHREVALLCAEALSEVFPLIKELTIN
jgi:hypothetical protein